MSVCLLASANATEGTVLKEHISRLLICHCGIYAQAKAKCSGLLQNFADFYRQGQYRNAFLAYTYNSLVSICKDTHFYQSYKFLFHSHCKSINYQLLAEAFWRAVYEILGLLYEMFNFKVFMQFVMW